MRNLVAAATKTCLPTDPIRAVGERPADGMGFKEAGSQRYTRAGKRPVVFDLSTIS